MTPEEPWLGLSAAPPSAPRCTPRTPLPQGSRICLLTRGDVFRGRGLIGRGAWGPVLHVLSRHGANLDSGDYGASGPQAPRHRQRLSSHTFRFRLGGG